ncbi:hypothetical protein CR513_21680, partial [Mucuna pruriens]
MVPNQSRFQNMIKKELEGFKEYAQRWHELAAQVQPPITERKMVTMFIDTLPSPYYDRIVGNVASNFADLVVVGERIELGIRRGKFTQTNNNANFTKKLAPERKKGEANADHRQHRTNTVRGKKVEQVVPLKPLEPPYPRSYDPNARCDYHGRAIGHDTERCWSLKHKVQDLLDNGLLGFEDKGPNVHSNPLPTNGTMAINAINHEDERIVNRESRKAIVSTYRVEEGSHQGQGNDVE